MNPLNLAATVPDTTVEGPGHRYALWVQGCSLRCPGCCNPGMFDTGPRRQVDPLALAAEVLATEVEGVSLLGGEPFEQAAALAHFAHAVRAGGRSVMVYSGYTLEELQASPDPDVRRLLQAVDLLVDGRYVEAARTTTRRWIGSTNQRLHFLTDRYRPEDPQFDAPNELELVLENGLLRLTGYPVLGAATRL